ncbi:hypothetical protein JCM1393_09920 [Clostridium carnis]
MRASTIVMIVASIGFILMGLAILKSKKIKKTLENSSAYSDLEKFIAFNGNFNVVVGLIGLVLGILDFFLEDKSKYIVIIFIIIMVASSIIQNKKGKSYRNF